MAEEVVNRQGDLSLHIFHKWKDTNLGNILAPVLAFVIEYPIATLFIAVFMGLSALPLVLFVSFVLYSFLFTMLGFAMVEGTLLMIADDCCFYAQCSHIFCVLCVNLHNSLSYLHVEFSRCGLHFCSKAERNSSLLFSITERNLGELCSSGTVTIRLNLVLSWYDF